MNEENLGKKLRKLSDRVLALHDTYWDALTIKEHSELREIEERLARLAQNRAS